MRAAMEMVIFMVVYFRSSIHGSAHHERKQQTSFAICEVDAGVPSSYSTISSESGGGMPIQQPLKYGFQKSVAPGETRPSGMGLL
eukprot:gene9804-biopygen9816